MDSRLRLAKALSRYEQTPSMRQAKVESVTGPELTIKLDGENIDRVRYLSSYTPSTGDTVWCIKFGPDLIVLGTLQQ